MMDYPAGFVLWAMKEYDDSIELAKNWCKSKNLTPEDVKIMRRGDQICVVKKQKVTSRENV